MKHVYLAVLGIASLTIQANEIHIRKATIDDFPQMWEIFHPIVQKGDTYVFHPETTYAEAKDYYWSNKSFFNFVATLDNKILGMYTIKANQPGLGSHVANASYMVHPEYQGRGIGSLMAADSIQKAKELGFKAMQFNMVVSTNAVAVKAWQKMGFAIVGTLPKVFNHQTYGYVDAYVMHRFLD